MSFFAAKTCRKAERKEKMKEEKITIETAIQCMAGERTVKIIKVVAESWKNSDLCHLTGIDENGGSHALTGMKDCEGTPLEQYEIADKWNFHEWLWSLYKETQYKIKNPQNPYHKEYCFTETGQEYCYESTDFKKHYTCSEE